MPESSAADPTPPPSKTNVDERVKPPASNVGHDEREWSIDEEGVVDVPSDHSDPDFNADLDPTDAP